MRVRIKKFGMDDTPNTINLNCDIKLSPELFQSLYWDNHDGKPLDEYAEGLGEMVKNAIIKHIKENQNKDGNNF